MLRFLRRGGAPTWFRSPTLPVWHVDSNNEDLQGPSQHPFDPCPTWRCRGFVGSLHKRLGESKWLPPNPRLVTDGGRCVRSGFPSLSPVTVSVSSSVKGSARVCPADPDRARPRAAWSSLSAASPAPARGAAPPASASRRPQVPSPTRTHTHLQDTEALPRLAPTVALSLAPPC